jgi:hypothetical protein
MARVRRDLTAQIGGEPTAIQRLLIQRAAMLTLRLAKLDDKIVGETGNLTLHDTNFVIAWQNALTRVLVALDISHAPRISGRILKLIVPDVTERAFDDFLRSVAGDEEAAA